MTNFMKGIVLLVISLVLFGCATSVKHQSQPDYQPIFFLEEVLTFSQFHQDNFQDLRLVNKPHQQLTIGEMVETNAKTVKTLSFDGTTKIILMPNSRVKLTAFGIKLPPNQQQQTHLFVDHYSLSSRSIFSVETQYVGILPFGTQFFIQADQQAVSVTVVKEAVLLSSNKRGSWGSEAVKEFERGIVSSENTLDIQSVPQTERITLLHPITQMEKLIQVAAAVSQPPVTPTKTETPLTSVKATTWSVTLENSVEIESKPILQFNKDGSVKFSAYYTKSQGNWKQKGNLISFNLINSYSDSKWTGRLKGRTLSGKFAYSDRYSFSWVAHPIDDAPKLERFALAFDCDKDMYSKESTTICLLERFEANIPVILLYNNSKTCLVKTGHTFTYSDDIGTFEATRLVNPEKCKILSGALIAILGQSSVEYTSLELTKLTNQSKIKRLDSMVRKSGLLNANRRKRKNDFLLVSEGERGFLQNISRSLPTVYKYPYPNKDLLFAQYQWEKWVKGVDGPILLYDKQKWVPMLGVCTHPLEAFKINDAYYLQSGHYLCGNMESHIIVIFRLDSSGITTVFSRFDDANSL
ncbi:secreted protein [Beggiatoa sp. PS]|nr:secreted protein [Beggiatoa sp. PS]